MGEREFRRCDTYLLALGIVCQDKVDIQGTVVIFAAYGLMRAPVRAFDILCIAEQLDRGEWRTERYTTVAESVLRTESPWLGVEEQRSGSDRAGLAAELINRALDRQFPIAQIGSE